MQKGLLVQIARMFKMKSRSSVRLMLLFVGLTSLVLLSVSQSAKATMITVAAGFDLFHTPAGNASFGGVDFVGVNLGIWDFGNGQVNVFDTDTIVQRLSDASVDVPPATFPETAGTIDIELVALQLRSVAPVDFGAGLDFHYVTLDPANSSMGTMDISFDNAFGGTFDSLINVDFDIRKGALNGSIIFSDILILTSTDSIWGRNHPGNAVQIAGVNHNLINDSLTGHFHDHDFWGVPQESHPSGAFHDPIPATVPEPTTVALLGIGLVGLAGAEVRRRRKKKAVDKS